MKALFIAAGVAAVTVTAPLSAQNFEGPYVGGQVGYNHDSYGRMDNRLGSVAIDNSSDSFTGGLFAGYDHHLTKKLVVGGEGGFDLGAGDRTYNRDSGASINPRHAFSLTARAGYQIQSQTLVYVRGGYENVDARTTVLTPTSARRDTRSYDGWTLGGGVERYLTTKVSARVEYRYSGLGGNDTRFHRQEGLFGLSYHF